MDANSSDTAPSKRAAGALRIVTAFWLSVAVIGQLLFVYYMTVHYGGSAIQGDFAAWGKSSLMGYVEGDAVGNTVFAAHIVLAIVLSLGGFLQLIPALRNRYRALHRWNGRLFFSASLLIAFGGLYLVWVRGATLGLHGALGISLNAALMIAFSVIAARYAMARNITLHRRWALRAFIVANGVWFFRVGLMAWIILNMGPRGVTENLDGPFDRFWALGNFLLPLAILELYLWVKDQAGTRGTWAMSVLLGIFTLIMALGLAGAFGFAWLPHLK